MTKLLSNLAALPASEPKMVNQIAVIGGWRKLDKPTLSTELKCLICEGTNHYNPLIDPELGSERVWICGNGHCAVNDKKNSIKATTIQVKPQRAILWPLFCEISGLGDRYHNVSYENIKQSEKTKNALSSFLTGDHPFLILFGQKGIGKTYSSLGLCELKTRTSDSCIFTTHRKMLDDWTNTFKEERPSGYIKKLEQTELLVVDDFGTAEASSKFMSFFMDLMNTRMQWKKRKTIITTNLDDPQFIKVCGDSLVDRFRTGININYSGESRR